MLHDGTGNILKHLIYRKGIAQEEINNDKNVGTKKSDCDIMKETDLLRILYFVCHVECALFLAQICKGKLRMCMIHG